MNDNKQMHQPHGGRWGGLSLIWHSSYYLYRFTVPATNDKF